MLKERSQFSKLFTEMIAVLHPVFNGRSQFQLDFSMVIGLLYLIFTGMIAVST